MKRNVSGNDVFTRAYTLDIKNLDKQLEKKLSKVFIKELGTSFSMKKEHKKEEWEIEVQKLDIHYVIAKGTYGMFVGATMVPADLRIPSKVRSGMESIPSRACCVVLEYLGGGTLKQYLIKNRAKGLSSEVFLQFALDLAEGLEYLHLKKIVHCEMKTENMLLDTKRNLKIADFGVARVETLNPSDMTGETGTVSYMAPEVLEGKPYNHKCDVYSYGICLWEMYCCKMSYVGYHFHELSTKVVRHNLRPEIPCRCPTKLAKLMKKCWDANPLTRLEMSEVVSKLEEINNGDGDPASSNFASLNNTKKFFKNDRLFS
ncbi:hypothetical protein LUZ60_002618 [Juncus effusus]|nr:hypothetical protein LUZ60_002618 [Juncus effusus]